jgi:hypothetical protein
VLRGLELGGLIDCQWMICIEVFGGLFDWLAALDSMIWCSQLCLSDSVFADAVLTGWHVHSRGIFCLCNNSKHVDACITPSHVWAEATVHVFFSGNHGKI